MSEADQITSDADDKLSRVYSEMSEERLRELIARPLTETSAGYARAELDRRGLSVVKSEASPKKPEDINPLVAAYRAHRSR